MNETLRGQTTGLSSSASCLLTAAEGMPRERAFQLGLLHPLPLSPPLLLGAADAVYLHELRLKCQCRWHKLGKATPSPSGETGLAPFISLMEAEAHDVSEPGWLLKAGGWLGVLIAAVLSCCDGTRPCNYEKCPAREEGGRFALCCSETMTFPDSFSPQEQEL